MIEEFGIGLLIGVGGAGALAFAIVLIGLMGWINRGSH